MKMTDFDFDILTSLLCLFKKKIERNLVVIRLKISNK